jgi:undecaprenyl-diphosphatase
VNFLEAIILGLVQGLTEFLPISSSAHLRIVGELIGREDPGAAFTAITQIGTETAVVVYFWKDITRIIAAWARSLVGKVPRSDPDARMGWFIILGSIPIVVLGLVFQDLIESELRSLWIVAVMLIVFGILLGVVDVVAARTRTLDKLTWPHAVVFGLAQALALIPGVSRSGGTITAGRALGYERPAAARYAFLLAIPAVFGSGLYQVYKSVIREPGNEVFGPAETLVATVIAGLVGFAVIAFLMRYISKRSFLPFVIYRVLLGGVLIVLLSTGVLTAADEDDHQPADREAERVRDDVAVVRGAAGQEEVLGRLRRDGQDEPDQRHDDPDPPTHQDRQQEPGRHEQQHVGAELEHGVTDILGDAVAGDELEQRTHARAVGAVEMGGPERDRREGDQVAAEQPGRDPPSATSVRPASAQLPGLVSSPGRPSPAGPSRRRR